MPLQGARQAIPGSNPSFLLRQPCHRNAIPPIIGTGRIFLFPCMWGFVRGFCPQRGSIHRFPFREAAVASTDTTQTPKSRRLDRRIVRLRATPPESLKPGRSRGQRQSHRRRVRDRNSPRSEPASRNRRPIDNLSPRPQFPGCALCSKERETPPVKPAASNFPVVPAFLCPTAARDPLLCG